MKKLIVTVSFVGCLAINQLKGADISWQSPVPDTGSASDIVTTGSLVETASANPSATTVNGVTFENHDTLSDGNVTFNNSSITMSGISNPSYPGGDGSYYPDSSWPAGYDANYATLVGAPYTTTLSGSSGNIYLNGLTIGDEYLVQIFEPFWDANWTTQFQGGANTSSTVYSAGVARDGNPDTNNPSYVLGTFVADSTNQTVVVSGPSAPEFTALQLRAVPEPSTYALLGLGALALLIACRRKVA